MNFYDAKCPNCQHAFQINDEQLSLKNGFVRCSHCKTIFSAADQIQLNKLSPKIKVDTQTKSEKSQLVQDKSGDILFDDESGLDEAGNPIINQEDILTSPYALSKTNSKSASKKSKFQSDEFDIIDNFDQLPKLKEPKRKQSTFDDKDIIQELVPTHEKDISKEENAWLESLMSQATANEDAQISSTSTSKPKSKENATFNADILDQIEISASEENPSDLLTYQKKIDQRFSQQVSSQNVNPAKFSSMRLIWGIGSILLLVGLVVQYIIFNINELVTSKPTAARLASVCQMFSPKCNLPIADTDLINVDVLKLSSSTKQPNQTDLIFTLTNTTDNKIVYPNLKVSLRSGNTIQAQTLITSVNYLEAGNNYLMPHQIKPMKLRIDFPKSKAQQANVELFY